MRLIGAGMLVVLWAAATLLAEEVVDRCVNGPGAVLDVFGGLVVLVTA